MQERLLELWLGDRRDLCVVGDEDQTIYTFTGATSRFLTGFAERHPDARVIELAENYRSTPAGPRARQQPAGLDRAEQAARRHAAAGTGTGRRPARHRGGRARRPRPLGRRTDRRRHRPGRDRDPGPDQRPAGPDRGRPHPGRHRLPGPRRPVLRPAPTSAARSTWSGGPGSRRPGPALAGDIRALWAAKLGLRRRHRGRPRRRGGPRADGRPRHAARHPRDAGALRRPRGCRRRTSPSSTGDARRSARARPTA